MRLLITLVICLFSATQVAANQCSAVFPDGASTHSAGGTIYFGFNSRLIGSDNNFLATTAISKNGGSSINTCNTVDCIATGAPSNAASAVSFQSTTSTIDVSLNYQGSVVVGTGSFSGNEFDDINPSWASEASITFAATHSEYFVDSLVLAFQNTLYLQAGATYWINQLTMSSQAEIVVLGTGTALIYVNQNLSFPSPGLINSPSNNSSGDASKLVMYAFGDVSFNNNSTYTGSLYVAGNLTLGSSSYAFGAVSAANIQLGSQSNVTYQSAEVAETDFGNICDSSPPVVVEPILDYRFDECSYTGAAADIIDQKGNFNGSSNGVSPSLDAAIINQPLDLSANNTSDWVAVPSSVVDGLDDFSVSVWVKTSVDKSQQNIFHALGNNTNDDELEIFLKDNNTVYIKVRDNSEQLNSAIELTDGNWHHLVLTRVDEDVCLFVDGTAQECDDGVNDGVLSVSNPNAIVIGQEQDSFGGDFSTNQNFVGQLDEFKIYNVKLSGGDVNSLYQNESASNNYDGSTRATVSCPQVPVGFYQFEQDSWSSAGDVLDSSDLANHGDPLGSISPFFNSATQKSCQALKIDNNTSSAVNAVDTGIDINSLGNDGTISFWYRSNNPWSGGGNRQLIDASSRSAGDKYFFLVLRSNGSLRFGLEYNGDDDLYSTTSNFSFAANEWVHIAVTWNPLAAELELYVNGSKAATTDSIETPGGGSLDNMGNLYIGDNSSTYAVNGSSFNSANGYFDDVRIYNFIQSQSAIEADRLDVSTCSKEPVAEYHFDEVSWNGTENEVADNSSSSLDGSAVGNTTTIDAGQVCRAGTFDGDGDYIDVSGIDSYLNTTASLSFWIKTSLSGNNTAWNAPGIMGVEQRGGSNDIFWGYLDASGRIRIQKGNGSSAQSSTVITDNNWHHVVLTWDSLTGLVQVFVDGILEDSASSTTGDVSTTFSSIGRIEGSFSSLNFNGQLDELLVFDSVISASYVDSIYNNQLNGDNYDGSARICPTNSVHHYEISHDGQGFTCEAESMTIKACANESCDTLYTEETAITLSPSGWAGGNTLVFTGELITNLSVTDEGTITMGKTSASPDADLRCFDGSTETCDITFSNDGFEIYGANPGDPLPDQLAASNFSNVNLRAVRSNNNVCEPLLQGTQEISLTYDCDTPNQCLTPLNEISITNALGENTGNIEVEFNAQGVASLDLLNYPDAGRLSLSVQAVVNGVTISNSDNESVDVYPSYLALSVAETELVYGNPDINEQNNYVSGESFTFVVGAYGVNKELLLNYQAEAPQLKITRISPTGAGENGYFKYSESSPRITNGLFTDVVDISSSDGVNHFDKGEYRYDGAYYSEVGRVAIELRDADYLGNPIEAADTLTLGDFYPKFFKVETTGIPTLADTCSATFSYLGQNINFDTPPEITLTAYNALGEITRNYSDVYWNYLPDKSSVDTYLSYLDSSTYLDEVSNSIRVIDLGDAPVLTQDNNYDGTGVITLNNGSFQYNKVNPSDSSAYAPVDPFAASINLEFASDFFTSTFTDQNGAVDTICYQASHTDSACLDLKINNVTGTQMRYGRLTLESTYGPETEPLNVPIKMEYYNAGQWLLNTDDSNCTSIDFTEGNNEIQHSNTSFANAFNTVTSTGVLIAGVAVGNQFTLDAPNTAGELNIWLDPTAINVTWPTYLNYDWNGDGMICNEVLDCPDDGNTTDSDSAPDIDYPKATVTFGQFRGNDRIIHWREVFN